MRDNFQHRFRRRWANRSATQLLAQDFTIILLVIMGLVALANILGSQSIPMPILSLLPSLETGFEARLFADLISTLGISPINAGTSVPALGLQQASELSITSLTILLSAMIALNIRLMRRVTRVLAWRRPQFEV